MGYGAYCTSTPAPSDPMPWPRVGPIALIRVPRPGACGGLSSINAALNAPVAVPTPMPCTTRAAISQPTPSATLNNSMDASTSAVATSSTGRRPITSDSEPKTSRLVSTASAYTPNTRVSTPAENRHWCW